MDPNTQQCMEQIHDHHNHKWAKRVGSYVSSRRGYSKIQLIHAKGRIFSAFGKTGEKFLIEYVFYG